MHTPALSAWHDEARRGSPSIADLDTAYAQPLPAAARLAFERMSEGDLSALDDLEVQLPAFPGPLLLLDQCNDERASLLHEPGRRAAVASAPVLWQRRFDQWCSRVNLPAVLVLAARWSTTQRTERSRRTGVPRWGGVQN